MNMYQDDFADSLGTPAFGQAARSSWFKRNWFWFVPLLIMGPIFCCCGGIGLFMYWGVGEIKNLPPYVDSVAAAEQDPAVQQALGTPIEVATFMGVPSEGNFDFNLDSSGRQLDADFKLNGSSASGTLRIEAQSTDGVNWTYTVREVELADGTVIDLLPAGNSPPETNEPEGVDEPKTETPE